MAYDPETGEFTLLPTPSEMWQMARPDMEQSDEDAALLRELCEPGRALGRWVQFLVDMERYCLDTIGGSLDLSTPLGMAQAQAYQSKAKVLGELRVAWQMYLQGTPPRPEEDEKR